MTELEPVEGPRAVCDVCGAELLGRGRIEHNADGSHSYEPAEDEGNDVIEEEEA